MKSHYTEEELAAMDWNVCFYKRSLEKDGIFKVQMVAPIDYTYGALTFYATATEDDVDQYHPEAGENYRDYYNLVIPGHGRYDYATIKHLVRRLYDRWADVIAKLGE